MTFTEGKLINQKQAIISNLGWEGGSGRELVYGNGRAIEPLVYNL